MHFFLSSRLFRLLLVFLPGLLVSLTAATAQTNHNEYHYGLEYVQGPDFEAGVSFGRTDEPVYRYFTPKPN